MLIRPSSSTSAPAGIASKPVQTPHVSERFGKRLKVLRQEHNLTQQRMAESFGIDRSFISDVERGNRSISLHTLEIVAIGMKMTLSELLDTV